MKDARPNIKVSTETRRLIKLLAAHYDMSQPEVIQMLAEERCRKIGLLIEKK